MTEKIKILVIEDDELRIQSFKERFFSLFNTDNPKGLIGEVNYVKTSNEAIHILKENIQFDIIFLDHDLGNRQMVSSEDENTGSEVVRYIVEHSNNFQHTLFIIHSFNPVGADYMLYELSKFTDDVKYIPSIWTKEIFEKYIRIK